VIAAVFALAVIGAMMEDSTANQPAGSAPAGSTDPDIQAGQLFISECGSYYDSGDMDGFNSCIDPVTAEHRP
jgi:hypothetical protein